jgi:hypothetical protein
MSENLTPEELEKFIHRELRALPARKAPAGFESRLQAAIEARTGVRSESSARLEAVVHRELRSLPLRKAPATLESRVLAAIEHQSAIAWYHKSWSYWPAAIRAAFLVVATAVAGGVMGAFYLMAQGVDTGALVESATARLGLFTKLYHAALWTTDFAANAFSNIPSLWLYGGVAFVGALYATFFGLGAAAYRTLYRQN